jgi:hypothetical protein
MNYEHVKLDDYKYEFVESYIGLLEDMIILMG